MNHVEENRWVVLKWEQNGVAHDDCKDHWNGLNPPQGGVEGHNVASTPPTLVKQVRGEGLDHNPASRDIRPARKKRSGEQDRETQDW